MGREVRKRSLARSVSGILMRGLAFLALFVFANACSEVNGPCKSNADCCVNPCAASSCVSGTCVGSYCLGFGARCELDCQCCSGYCDSDIDNTPRCSVPNARLVADDPDPACCFDSTNYFFCKICCPLGSPAMCSVGEGCSCGHGMTSALACAGSGVSVQAHGNVTVSTLQRGGAMVECHEPQGCLASCTVTHSASSSLSIEAVVVISVFCTILAGAGVVVIVVIVRKLRTAHYSTIV